MALRAGGGGLPVRLGAPGLVATSDRGRRAKARSEAKNEFGAKTARLVYASPTSNSQNAGPYEHLAFVETHIFFFVYLT